MGEPTLVEKLMLAEIDGKNRAIHAYDKMMWTVRTGFLTLFFGGWGILLKGLLENPATRSGRVDSRVLLAMLLVSIALGIGGLVIDRNYARRKFRVIYSLDKLTSSVVRRSPVLEKLDDIETFLQVSGDKSNETYREVSGYRHEMAASWTIYLVPITIGIIVACLLGSDVPALFQAPLDVAPH